MAQPEVNEMAAVETGGSHVQSSASETSSSEDFEGKPVSRRPLAGNWTVWWILGVVTSAAFFWPLNKPNQSAYARQPFGPCIWIHLVGAGTISLVCLVNIFHTPSHGPRYCVFHRWLGRVGVVASFVGVAFGIITAWWERYSPDNTGMAIGLTILGCLQTYYTIAGFWHVRKAVALRDRDGTDKDLFKQHIDAHKFNMIGLWMSCLAPAWFRIPQMLGASADSSLMFLGLIPTLFWGQATGKAMHRGSWC